MTIDRTTALQMTLGLAAVVLIPLWSNGADVKRLPPVDSERSTPRFTGPRSPIVSHSMPKAVRQLIWHQPDAGPGAQIGSANLLRPVKLVNWNEEEFVPPVYIDTDSTEEPTTAIPFQLVSQPSGQSSAPPAPQPAVPALQSVVPPALESAVPSALESAAPSVLESAAPSVLESTAPSVLEAPPVLESAAPPAPEADAPPPDPSGVTQPPQSATRTAPESAAKSSTKPLAETIDSGFVFENSSDGSDYTTCGSCWPRGWYFQGDAVVLGRTNVRTIKLVEEGTVPPARGQGNALLTTDALDPNFAWGPRISIGHNLDDSRNLEMTYFGLNYWNSVAAFDGINGVGPSFNNIDVPFNSNYTSDFGDATYVSATYSSQIQSAEVNLLSNNRWDLNQSAGFEWHNYVDFLAGVRYFRLSERFDLQSSDAGNTSDYLIRTANDLIGGQIGMIAGTYHSDRVSWNIVTKAGMYINSGNQSTLLRDNNNSVVLRDFSTHDNELAFISDTSFNIAYDLRPNMALTVGYNLVYVGGVALAPEQLDFTTTSTSGSSLNQNGGVFYYGASIGLRFVY